MNTAKDYYKVLGVDKSAGDEDIKRAYRKLALRFHPDKNKAPDAEEKFKAINEAYGALIDRSKREVHHNSRRQGYRPTRQETSSYRGHQGRYDEFFAFRRSYDPGSTYQQTSGFGCTFQQAYCPGSRFQQTFGPGRLFQQSFGPEGTFKQTLRHGNSFQHTFGFSCGTFQATFSFGSGVGMSYNCSGTESDGTCTASQSRSTAHAFWNAASGSSPDANLHCSAFRKSSHTEPVSTMYREIFVTLEEVLSGCSKKLKISWDVEAQGDHSVRRSEKIVEMTLEPGVTSGTKMTFQCPGVQKSSSSPAAVVLVIRDKKHPLFKRNGADIHYVAQLTPWEARWSTRIEVPTLTMEKILLPLARPVLSGTITRIKGEGLPYHGAPKKRGDLFVIFQVHSATP